MTVTRAPILDSLTALPADPLLGVMAAFRADPRADKVDLGVGVYRDIHGHTPVMRAVKAAEARVMAKEDTKVYEGPAGNLVFTERAARLTLGEDLHGRLRERLSVFSTPGGSGALRMGAELIRQARPDARIWLSEPTWANHAKLVSSSGLALEFYDYWDEGAANASLDKVLASLSAARAGDAILLQGPCHNPTGADFTLAEWTRLANEIAPRGLFPFVDVAYQGLGEGLDADVAGVREFLARVPEALVATSMSKNFGLYRERTGALMAISQTKAIAAVVDTRLASIARGLYSMPPAHGHAIVAEILGDEALTAMWRAELEEMRLRIVELRAAFSRGLNDAYKTNSFAPVADQKGMFSILPLSEAQVATLAQKHAIYMPHMGRVNIAGLSPETIAHVCAAFAAV